MTSEPETDIGPVREDRALFDDLAATPQPAPAPALLPRRRRRRGTVRVAVLVVLAVVAGYCGTTLFWSVDAIQPRISAVEVTPVPAAKAAMTWPVKGAAGVAVAGYGPSVASTTRQLSMASITKLVTVLTVLQRKPLSSGEGPRYRFTAKDRTTYHRYLERNESALDVPVGGSLTEYQMFQGILIGSASNYAARIVKDTFGTKAAFVAAARQLLHRNGITGITIVDPTGFERGNKATPAALLKLASLAMKDATIASIVVSPRVVLPGAGSVSNTNGLIRDDGVNGLKTGTLVGYDLLAAKTIQVDSITVQLYAVSLYQPSEHARNAATRHLFDQLQAQLQVKPTVAKGTPVGEVRTVWGERVPVVAGRDAGVVLWNGATAQVSTTLSLGDQRTAGAVVGTLRATGPLNSTKVDAVLGRDVAPPSPWWRLTHPLQLWGLQQH